jgi:hypothetical protein
MYTASLLFPFGGLHESALVQRSGLLPYLQSNEIKSCILNQSVNIKTVPNQIDNILCKTKIE